MREHPCRDATGLHRNRMCNGGDFLRLAGARLHESGHSSPQLGGDAVGVEDQEKGPRRSGWRVASGAARSERICREPE